MRQFDPERARYEHMVQGMREEAYLLVRMTPLSLRRAMYLTNGTRSQIHADLARVADDGDVPDVARAACVTDFMRLVPDHYLPELLVALAAEAEGVSCDD